MCRYYRKGLAAFLAVVALTLINPLHATGSDPRVFVLSLSASDGERMSAAQLQAENSMVADLPEHTTGVALQEEFRSPDTWFMTVHAPDQEAVNTYLQELDVQANSIIESLFINSPELGGGPKAADTPKEGHSIYMIQRQIPGIGLAPMEQKVAVSKGSQKIIESLDGEVEWDQSFLTSEGTFCVYRAGDPSMIEEHARIAGIPADPIIQVEHIVHDMKFHKN